MENNSLLQMLEKVHEQEKERLYKRAKNNEITNEENQKMNRISKFMDNEELMNNHSYFEIMKNTFTDDELLLSEQYQAYKIKCLLDTHSNEIKEFININKFLE